MIMIKRTIEKSNAISKHNDPQLVVIKIYFFNILIFKQIEESKDGSNIDK